MKLRKLLIPPRTVESDEGGLRSNGSFRVRVPFFGRKMIYSEGKNKIGLDGSFEVGTAFIRNWDGSSVPFERNQIREIETNIFAALGELHIRYTNIR